MNLQYIAERSLSLTEYVMEHVTKAEMSHAHRTYKMKLASVKTYNRPWIIGQKVLRSKVI
uniref:Uncharacterized protein n=1 Tax=Amphimedon queenslandica TaxID=400682 RepID=A0A1X7UT14_AMPQE